MSANNMSNRDGKKPSRLHSSAADQPAHDPFAAHARIVDLQEQIAGFRNLRDAVLEYEKHHLACMHDPDNLVKLIDAQAAHEIIFRLAHELENL